ncbi:MAG: hypothetical protein KJZ80_07470 [Hyphomicrobiaceae bacterium]|nr:hypothetical protein [Hyphomicrobiaceae bacterium]
MTTALVWSLSTGPAQANWLTRLLHEAGEAGGRAARHGAGALDDAAAHLKHLPPAKPGGAALAASVSQEGHWTFVNRAGERFTAGTPDEMKRVATVLAPEAAHTGGKLSLLLTEDTVFRHRSHLDALPEGAELRLLFGRQSYPLVRRSGTGADSVLAELRPNLLVGTGDRKVFAEAVWQLMRPLEKARIRVLALQPGSAKAMSPVPLIDPATRRAVTDTVDPFKLGDAVRAIRGQTVVVTGRVDGRLMYFLPPSGPEQRIILDDLIGAAARADVNVVVLHSATPRQPGARNWLWQRVEVAGLDEALRRASMGDFLNAVAAGKGRLVLTATDRGAGRVSVQAVALAGGPDSHAPGGILSEVVSELTGHVVSGAIRMDLASSERQQELEARIIPGIPSDLQLGYVGLLIAGLIGLSAARGWWGRVWPAEQRQQYAGALGFLAARVARLAAFVLVFLPLAGIPALLWTLALQIWGWTTLPVRAARWLTRRRAGEAA